MAHIVVRTNMEMVQIGFHEINHTKTDVFPLDVTMLGLV